MQKIIIFPAVFLRLSGGLLVLLSRMVEYTSFQRAKPTSALLLLIVLVSLLPIKSALANTVPDVFSFAAQTGMHLSAQAVSNTITVSGLDSTVAISIDGGKYSINGGSYTTASGMVKNGDLVTVQLTLLGLYNMTSSATLTIGGVSGAFSATTTNNPSGTVVRMQTSLGPIDIALFNSAAPLSVANFMGYVNSAAYNGSFIHRSVPGFIIQGGGYKWNGLTNTPVTIPANAPIQNEFSSSRPNVRGTLAMAKLGGDPNSATTEWYINLADNSANLDAQNGGFTVFGQVMGNGMQIVDAIAAIQVWNASILGAAFSNLPLAGPNGTALIMVNSISTLPPAITTSLPTGWNLLGNCTDVPLDVATALGDASKVNTVWKWVPASNKWAFFTTSLVGQALTDYVNSKGYEPLSTINSGEGFWVNAKQPFELTLPNGNFLAATASQPTLVTGWNLISTGETLSPGQYNVSLPSSFTSLWAWDNIQSNWYFYAPGIEAQGGTALSDYIAAKHYLDFTALNKYLGGGMGFWVNKP